MNQLQGKRWRTRKPAAARRPDLSDRHDPALIERHAELLAPPTSLGYLYQLWALGGWTSLIWLHRIRQPTLVLAGLDDPIVPRANSAKRS